MGVIENDAFRNGFKIGLLVRRTDRPGNRQAAEYVLFDGGRETERERREDSLLTPSTAFLGFVRRAVIKVLAPPHVLAVYGSGWRELLTCLPRQVVGELRLLDLQRTAVALKRPLPVSAGTEAIARAYGVAPVVDPESGELRGLEEILWAVLQTADRAGLTWDALRALPDTARAQAPLERYAFDEETLAALPHQPGVYVMRDADGGPLYVGKAADLAERLNGYFRAVLDLPPKLRTLRDRIRDLEIHGVGSELEALLLENRLIAGLEPEVNVQRRVAEERGRYGTPLTARALICPSAREGRVELFFFGGPRGRAVQLRIDPDRPPRRTLARLAAWLTGRAEACPHTARTTSWGPAGNALCSRYFGRFRHALQWLELPADRPPEAAADALLAAARRVARDRPEPGEFRLGPSNGGNGPRDP
ncbi:MAG: nucleotide excision repair endonuclease [Lentisphaerae bacterium]|nr:nucleotide excision repair endonuclease [Lentisphaerota bacterium]